MSNVGEAFLPRLAKRESFAYGEVRQIPPFIILTAKPFSCPRIFTNLPESFVTIRADSWADKRESFAYGEVCVSNVGEAFLPRYGEGNAPKKAELSEGRSPKAIAKRRASAPPIATPAGRPSVGG